ncbi:MAG: hypothetical protein JKX70_06630 [Phycisphaerales bacterium]|nr:hypothetical protein [Phycisphaerales bacterium]
MKIRTAVGAGLVASIAGMAMAQPTIDGVYDPATEGAFYSDLIWVQNLPTTFGDNEKGERLGGDLGNPEAVVTGTEIMIPLAALGNPGAFTIAGWINSGDRTFLSNQLIHDGLLPVDTSNIGGQPDWNTDPRFPNEEFATVNSFASGTPIVDGTLDAVYGAAHFIQTNFTGFGDNGDATDQGGGGSEIDGLYVASDGTNLYIFIAGNTEANGNALDLYIDTDFGKSGASLLGAGSGVGAFIIDAQSGMIFDSGFRPNYVLSVDSEDNGMRVPRAHFGAFSGNSATVNLLGTISGYGAAGAGALSGGDAGISASLAVNNSNIEGVGGSATDPTPTAPDADWAYGSELDNARVFIDEPNNKMYLFLAGNVEGNFNKLVLFFDSQPGGQNVILDNNVDISFNAVNNMSNITFDSAFSADYFMDINQGVDGGSGNLIRFADAATMRTEGALIDPFFGVIVDYGSFDGGDVSEFPMIPFAGPRIDLQDGSLGSLFANYGPRLSQIDPLNPIDNLIMVGINNSNVDGVTEFDASGASLVNTGIEICIDLDELGWDGVQDILVTGWIASSGFDFISNQVLGGIDGPDNVGPRDADSDGVNDLDFNAIAGEQFLNLSNPTVVDDCPADFTGDGNLNFFDVAAFLQAFGTMDPIADFTDDGSFDFFDVAAFLAAFGAGCP